MKRVGKIFWFLFCLGLLQVQGQIPEIIELPYKDLLDETDTQYLNGHYEYSITAKLIRDEDNILAFIYSRSGFTKCLSMDNGETWTYKKHILDLGEAYSPRIRYALDVAINSDGSYLIFAQPFEGNIISRLGPLAIWKFSSNDELLFRTDFDESYKEFFDLCRISDQEYYLSYFDKNYTDGKSASVIYRSIDGGKTWGFEKAIYEMRNASLEYSTIDKKIKAAYSLLKDESSEIYFCEDFLVDNVLPKSILVKTSVHTLPNTKLQKTDDGTFWLLYNNKTMIDYEYSHNDIQYIKSVDNGKTWSQVGNFTSYVGSDKLISTGRDAEFPLIFFISNRDNKQRDAFFIGNAGFSVDDAPPFIYKAYDLEEVDRLQSYVARVKVFDDDKVANVFIENKIGKIILWDDGNHFDSLANDNIYANIIPDIHPFFYETASLVDVNNFTMPLINKGVLADVNFGVKIKYTAEDNSNNYCYSEIGHKTHGSLGKYLDKGILFSAGFFLSGYKNDELFANAVASAALVIDYKAGQVGTSPDNPLNKVYVVRKDDPPFGYSWNEWKNAVKQGAYFYDGDGNGIYNPTDNNKNGIWEEDEDRPDLLYDATYFTVFNDRVSKVNRRWSTVEPLGIEIRQTIFASGTIPELQDVIFIRYSILYRGLDLLNEPDTLRDVIFSIWNDPDIGAMFSAASDDLVGCDTLLQSGYVYNDGEDDDWGTAPPALFRTILQGPPIKTSNMKDTLYNKMGRAIGEISAIGWRNSKIGSYRHYISSSIGFNDPNTAEEARNQMLGLTNLGDQPTPCDSWLGEVFGGVNCEEVNPYFWYSGDPVTNSGWICTAPLEQRDLVNTEKFTLIKNQPVDIIISYTVGHGTDHLSSITDGREKVKKIFEIYEQNFPGSYTPPNYEEIYPKDFSLSQNYPNPFNPTTAIKFTIPDVGAQLAEPQQTKLVIYNILGQRVKTLLNEVKAPGTYEVTFNSSKLASGIYFYRLTSGSFVQTKKMMLIK